MCGTRRRQGRVTPRSRGLGPRGRALVAGAEEQGSQPPRGWQRAALARVSDTQIPLSPLENGAIDLFRWSARYVERLAASHPVVLGLVLFVGAAVRFRKRWLTWLRARVHEALHRISFQSRSRPPLLPHVSVTSHAAEP